MTSTNFFSDLLHEQTSNQNRLAPSDSLPGNVFVDDGKGKFEVSAVTIFNCALDDLAVDVEKVAEIGLIVFEVFEQVFIKIE